MIAFSLSIFISAFLLFIAQPLIAKKLLPWFGGSPAVWLCNVLFFQLALLMGYLYAYFLTKINKVSLQVIIHVIFLLGSLCFLPIFPEEKLTTYPLWPPIAIISLLSTSLLLPIIMISTSSPLLQHWYCRTYQTDFPYRFYALSNLGSLLGLLAFPFLLEPLLGLKTQLLSWSMLYGAFLLCTGLCMVIVVRQHKATTQIIPNTKAEPLAKSTLFYWLMLTAMSCTLLLTTTQIMMESVASFPMLWIIPLALYLISYIITFSSLKVRFPRVWMSAYGLFCAVILLIPTHHEFPLILQFVAFSGLLFSGCMLCHGELVRLKPSKEYLTFYYLLIAAGGVIGGIFVNLISPLLFNEWWDFYIALIGIFILAGFLSFFRTKEIPTLGQQFFNVLWLISLGGISFLLATHINHSGQQVILSQRNFFGKFEVIEFAHSHDYYQRTLRNGNILHGQQYLDPKLRTQPTSYFSHNSGVGLAIEFQRDFKKRQRISSNLRIGVIGLGTGTIAALANKCDLLHFYEIDADIVNIANNYFYYLKDTKAKTDIIIDDGRIALAKKLTEAGSENYDVLVIDAFNGDGIPLHLLTVEAMKVYLSHLAPNGILAFHISSRYVDLYPPLQALATTFQIPAYLTYNRSDSKKWISHSEWVLLCQQEDFGFFIYQKDALSFRNERMNTAWTDDFNYLLSVIRW